MPYKKKSPFASFSDPKRAVRSYNPTDFQMPDINSIFEKKADGEVVTQASKDKDKGTAADNSITPSLAKLDKQAEQKEADVTRRSLRQDRRAGEKEFNKELRRVKQLSKASTKDITAQQREKFIEAKDKIQTEKDFRKESKKEGFNPADYKTKLMMDEQAAKVKKMDKDGAQNFPGTPGSNALKPKSIVSAPDGEDSPEWWKLAEANADIMFMENSLGKKKQDALFNPLGRGPQMNKNMKQVNSKGSGFPMIQPNQNAAEQQMPQQMPNRAGRSVESNQLVNDPNVNQPMNKVPASSFQRNAQFGDIASSPGVPNPAPMPNTIPQTSVFPQQPNQQQGAFAAYSSPDRVQNTEAGSVINAGRNMQEGIEDLGDSFSKKEDETNNGLGMYDGPSKALVGNQDRLPEHLKAKIEAAPGMYDGPSMKSAFKAFENDHLKTKVTKGNLKATERDDAAHMSYLKRDVKYDNTHGGSNKQMLNDEKHISKLAGDLKYDAKKKRS
tara:strand:- start:442 stop:1935 length:1494 start_codon:yes stop_codon:yes gene_type:complete